MKSVFYHFIILASFIISIETHAFENVWVSEDHAALKADNRFSAETTTSLSKGTELTVIEIEKRWFQVKTPSGESGWIHKKNVLTYPPYLTATDESIDLFDEMPESSAEIQIASTERSIRGRMELFQEKDDSPDLIQSQICLPISVQSIDYNSQCAILEKIWVTSENAPLKTSWSVPAAAITTLTLGMELSVISYEYQGYWVETPFGETGWIYQGDVTGERP